MNSPSAHSPPPPGPRVGIDAGGTFTDFVVRDRDGRERVLKVPSTPANPARAVLEGLRGLVGRLEGVEVIHGTTVATNALLERRGARTALVTNDGFVDLIEIGRQSRPRIYALRIERPPALVPRELRFGVATRTLATGDTRARAPESALDSLVERLRAARVESIAVSFLHSYAFPDEERRAGERLRALGVPVTLSSELLPVVREYERSMTAVANAYLQPLFARYLDDLDRALGGARLSIVQSNGGSVSAASARDEPVRAVLSGPAGGAIGALREGIAAGFPRVVGLDMGGTSTDVCVLDGKVAARERCEVAGVPVAVPTLDVHTVGAGGGSLAWRDEGGALRVGPRSAGADPGPVCYGRGGTEPTLTDAHVVLGTILPDRFLGGAMKLDAPAARAAMEKLARSLGVAVERAALGIVEVALARMERALRVVTVERGIDPRGFTLVAFGGAGPLHAAALVDRLRLARALVPRDPGALSARGMLDADVVVDVQRSVHLDARDREQLAAIGEELRARSLERLAAEGVAGVVELVALARYRGQAHELEVPWTDDVAARFHEVHEARNGSRDERRPVEVVTVRARGIGGRTVPPRARAPERPGDGARARVARVRAVIDRETDAWVVDRDRLEPGDRVDGPSIVFDGTATTVVPAPFVARVDGLGNLILERRP